MSTVLSKRRFGVFLLVVVVLALTVGPAFAGGKGFARHPVITLDGEDYYWVRLPDGPIGVNDVPRHTWRPAGPNRWVAKHYNTGPVGAPNETNWWSSDAPDGELLYIAHVIVDEWSEEKAAVYASKGYTHYHEFVRVTDGEHHPTLVGWFKLTARTSFTLNGGPAPQFAHEVTPGVDFEFIPNWMNPYPPRTARVMS